MNNIFRNYGKEQVAESSQANIWYCLKIEADRIPDQREAYIFSSPELLSSVGG